MAVLLETTLGDVVIDLYTEERPRGETRAPVPSGPGPDLLSSLFLRCRVPLTGFELLGYWSHDRAILLAGRGSKKSFCEEQPLSCIWGEPIGWRVLVALNACDVCLCVRGGGWKCRLHILCA